MKQNRGLMGSVLFVTAASWGCETASETAVGGGISSQQETAKAVMDYRKLAAELREMARRREIEAEVMAKQPNPYQARISHWREMAQQLRKEADAAEEHAREMQPGSYLMG